MVYMSQRDFRTQRQGNAKLESVEKETSVCIQKMKTGQELCVRRAKQMDGERVWRDSGYPKDG